MPSYLYKCEACDHEFTKILKISDRDHPLEQPCPECMELKLIRPPVSASFIYNPSGQIKTTDSFNDRLIEIKRTKGVDNTIQTRRSPV